MPPQVPCPTRQTNRRPIFFFLFMHDHIFIFEYKRSSNRAFYSVKDVAEKGVFQTNWPCNNIQIICIWNKQLGSSEMGRKNKNLRIRSLLDVRKQFCAHNEHPWRELPVYDRKCWNRRVQHDIILEKGAQGGWVRKIPFTNAWNWNVEILTNNSKLGVHYCLSPCEIWKNNDFWTFILFINALLWLESKHRLNLLRISKSYTERFKTIQRSELPFKGCSAAMKSRFLKSQYIVIKTFQ